MSNATSDNHRSPEQAAREQRFGELSDVLLNLERSHKRLMQDTYYAGDSVRLI